MADATRIEFQSFLEAFDNETEEVLNNIVETLQKRSDSPQQVTGMIPQIRNALAAQQSFDINKIATSIYGEHGGEPQNDAALEDVEEKIKEQTEKIGLWDQTMLKYCKAEHDLFKNKIIPTIDELIKAYQNPNIDKDKILHEWTFLKKVYQKSNLMRLLNSLRRSKRKIWKNVEDAKRNIEGLKKEGYRSADPEEIDKCEKFVESMEKLTLAIDNDYKEMKRVNNKMGKRAFNPRRNSFLDLIQKNNNVSKDQLAQDIQNALSEAREWREFCGTVVDLLQDIDRLANFLLQYDASLQHVMENEYQNTVKPTYQRNNQNNNRRRMRPHP